MHTGHQNGVEVSPVMRVFFLVIVAALVIALAGLEAIASRLPAIVPVPDTSSSWSAP